eukprot:CAMPEP_0173284188 /NCGR_PEP_ID=MMETSP1143-20121109/7883_1 /TAXON_ID=483371 /ORGANISM="non described non described, Strain CCMP2298" /LENGTH=184 /DNA_ID=CAMNT_0014222135 /DNA_START=170 /DNA_END=721 /DNA_ORIENTATION=-
MASAAMQNQFVLRYVREFLGPTGDPQLRLVSRFCRDELATTPVEDLKIKDFVSSVPLISWAWRELNMPRTNLVTEEIARDGQLKVLQWLRAQDTPCPWDECTSALVGMRGHLDMLRWMRSQDPPCPWNELTCAGAAKGNHLDLLQWLREQDPPCPWTEGTCASAAKNGHLDLLQWLRAQDPPCP